MFEHFRRLATLILLLAAAWTAVYIVPGLLQVQLVDIEKRRAELREQERDTNRLMAGEVGSEKIKGFRLHPEADLPADKLMASELSGRTVVHVSGSAWKDFFDNATATAKQNPPSPEWREHYSLYGDPYDLCFRTDHPLLSQLRSAVNREHSFAYVALGEGSNTRYLAVSFVRVSEETRRATPSVTSPYRHLSPWLLLAALAIYILLPWPKHGPDTITYKRLNSIILPDWLGFVMAIFFFSLVLLVCSRDDNMAVYLEGSSWTAITLWACPFVLLGLSVVAVGGWYASFSLQLLPDRLRLTTWRGADELAFADITEMRPFEIGPPRWLRVLLILSIFISAGTAAVSLAAVMRTYSGLELSRRNGRPLRIITDYLPESDRLRKALAQAKKLDRVQT